MTKISFDVEPELHKAFKTYCAENKCSITDTVSDFIKQITGAPKADAGSPALTDGNGEPSPEEAERLEETNNIIECVTDSCIDHLEGKLKPISEGLNSVTSTTDDLLKQCNDFRGWCDTFGRWLPHINAKLAEIDHKFVITGKLIDSAMTTIEQLHPDGLLGGGAKKCEDDLKGLAVLKGEESNHGGENT